MYNETPVQIIGETERAKGVDMFPLHMEIPDNIPYFQYQVYLMNLDTDLSIYKVLVINYYDDDDDNIFFYTGHDSRYPEST